MVRGCNKRKFVFDSYSFPGVKASWVSYMLAKRGSHIPHAIWSGNAYDWCRAFHSRNTKKRSSDTFFHDKKKRFISSKRRLAWFNCNVSIVYNSSCRTQYLSNLIFHISYSNPDCLRFWRKNIIYLNSIVHLFCVTSIVRFYVKKASEPEFNHIKLPFKMVSADSTAVWSILELLWLTIVYVSLKKNDQFLLIRAGVSRCFRWNVWLSVLLINLVYFLANHTITLSNRFNPTFELKCGQNLVK